MAVEQSPPLFPLDPLTRAIQLPSDVVHELFHLVQAGQKAEAVKRVRELTGASLKAAQDYVDVLLQRR